MIKKHVVGLIVGFLLLCFCHCQTVEKDFEFADQNNRPSEISTDEPSLDYEAKKEIEALAKQKERATSPFDLSPWIEHPEVEKWIKYFSKNARSGFIQQIQKGEELRPMIESIFIDKGLPTDLYYLALIESGFSFKARSPAQAAGMWQFVGGTARRYRLKINAFEDERQDPIRATVAAASYLADLHRVFQSWTLALAAYNSGEGRVLNTVMNRGTRNYWTLCEKKALPRETVNYVPKFIAAAWVARHPELYGLPEVEKSHMPPLQGAKVSSGVLLKDIAKVVGLSLQDVKNLNPHILRDRIPPGHSSYSIWLPKSVLSTKIEIELVELKKFTPSKTLKYASSKHKNEIPHGSNEQLHKIQKGESLISISKLYGTNPKILRSLNQMRGSKLREGRVLIVPSLEKIVCKKNVDHSIYTVKKGDTLFHIAQRHGITLQNLRSHNKLVRGHIREGQELHLPESS